MAASPFLLSKMKNPRVGESVRVKLPGDIPIEVASQLVHYLYDSRVTLTSQNVAQFGRIAKLFNLEHLQKICHEFVNNFSLDKTILNFPVEDISISVVSASDPSKSQTQSTQNLTKPNGTILQQSPQQIGEATAVNTNNKSKPSESPTNKVDKAKTPPPKPTHLYGTRSASGSVKKRAYNYEEALPKENMLVSPKKSTAPQSSSTNPVKGGQSVQIQGTERNQTSHIMSHPRKRRLSMMARESESYGVDNSVDDLLDDLDEDDDEDDYVAPVPQITTQSGMQRAVFEGTRKGKTLKTLKRNTALSQALKKNKK